MDILLASLLSPITLAFVAGMVASFLGLRIRVGDRALRVFADFLMFFIGVDGGRGLASASLQSLGAGLAATAAFIVLLPALSFVIARCLTKFSVVDSASLAVLYGSVSSAVLVAAYAESADMGLVVDELALGLAALMELGLVVALVIGALTLRRTAGMAARTRSRVFDVVGGFSLLFVGLFVGSLIGERRFGRWDSTFDVVLMGALVVYMLEMGMVTADAFPRLGAKASRAVSYGLVMPTVGAVIGTLLATVAGLAPGTAFILGAVAASASFINAPMLVRVSFPAANPAIYLTCAVGVTFPVLLIIGLPLIAQMALFWPRLIGSIAG
ncbi:MAG: sodium-dependent bicarbonate transport family permease [Xanthomonadaceae bacterium]|nr:sodium-dependent bicarbonate transport family permease [Xanthomonadaceae bacterium]